VSGSSPFSFSLKEYDIFYECELISIWDPMSQPIGKRRGNSVFLVDNTYFATISHHLIQHYLVESNKSIAPVDSNWASVGTMKKVIAERMYLEWPCHTAIAIMIEYLMEFETLNIKINNFIRENHEFEKLIKLTSRACTASSSYHELGHFLYANECFRYDYFQDVDLLENSHVVKMNLIDMREEIFCDSLGLYMTAMELITDGYDWKSSFELAKVSLYGGHMTLLCQQLAISNLALNEPESGAEEKDISAKIKELDYRFEAAVNHAYSKLVSEFTNKPRKIRIPLIFSKNQFTSALQQASELPCKDIGVRRISSLLAKAFMRSKESNFDFVINNAHQFSKTGDYHSFDSLKT
jgi:hypothetical protein